jgi:putative endonuclease
MRRQRTKTDSPANDGDSHSSWLVYFVRCRDHSLYCGITPDLAARLKKHNDGRGAKYTRSRRPVELAWSKEVATKPEALKIEAKLKRLSKKDKERLCS